MWTIPVLYFWISLQKVTISSRMVSPECGTMVTMVVPYAECGTMVTMVVPYAAGGHCWPFDLKQYHDPSDVQDKTLCQIGTT